MPFKIIKKLRSKLMRFPMNNRGNIAMTFGLCLIPVVIAVGIAIDLNRALIVRERLSQAIDTAALALAATGADSMTEAQQDQFVQDFMDANYAGIENKGSTDPADQIANFKIGYIEHWYSW